MNWISVIRKGPIPIYLAVSVIDGWIFRDFIKPFVGQIEGWLGGVILAWFSLWIWSARRAKRSHLAVHEGLLMVLFISLGYQCIKVPLLEMAKKSGANLDCSLDLFFFLIAQHPLDLTMQMISVMIIGRALVWAVESMGEIELSLRGIKAEPPKTKSHTSNPEFRLKSKNVPPKKNKKRRHRAAHGRAKSYGSGRSENLQEDRRQT
jgi:hypothetical protein